MLDALRRLIGGKAAGPDWSGVTAWAKSAGHSFKRSRDRQGFVIASERWRLEAGPPQRDYIDGPELRLRAEAEMPSDLQMLVMSRALMAGLERETFEQFTDSLQTYADDSTPEEMRWLAMFPKLDAAALGSLHARFGAVALVPAAVQAWLGGVLSARLQAAALMLPDDQPIVLMTNRGRVTLRTECHSLEGAALANWIVLFETALDALPDAVKALREATA
jgi:hypothetical protein